MRFRKGPHPDPVEGEERSSKTSNPRPVAGVRPAELWWGIEVHRSGQGGAGEIYRDRETIGRRVAA